MQYYRSAPSLSNFIIVLNLKCMNAAEKYSCVTISSYWHHEGEKGMKLRIQEEGKKKEVRPTGRWGERKQSFSEKCSETRFKTPSVSRHQRSLQSGWLQPKLKCLLVSQFFDGWQNKPVKDSWQAAASPAVFIFSHESSSGFASFFFVCVCMCEAE